MRVKRLNLARLEQLVDRRSGMLGVSGFSGDMRDLKTAASDAHARLAVEMFGYGVRKQIAAMISVLGGVDGLVFTGGIGENDDALRAAVCRGLGFMGVDLDLVRNQATENPLNAPTSRCAILVLPSQEEERIAAHTQALATAPTP